MDGRWTDGRTLDGWTDAGPSLTPILLGSCSPGLAAKLAGLAALIQMTARDPAIRAVLADNPV